MKLVVFLLTPVLVFAAPKKSSSSGSSTHHVAAGSKRKGRTVRKRGPSYQTHPTPERYQEIQQALADKGYFKGEVNGQWGADSVDALKRFQADHKLATDGKIGSLSLIQLGLGPKHNGNAQAPAAAGVPAEAPPPVTEAAPPQSSAQ